MKQILLAIILLCSAIASSTRAAVVVYTDRAAWEAAVLEVPTGHFHSQDFESVPTGSLSTGLNSFHPFYVDLPGAPGFNAIDGSFAADPFANALSPNGSTYYLGDVGVNASIPTILSFFDYPEMYEVVGFGADWVVQGDLIIEVQGTIIPFSTYVPAGSGFLGIVTDQAEVTLTANLFGAAVIGMDEIYTGNISVPIPAAAWLFGSALLGLGFFKRKRDQDY